MYILVIMVESKPAIEVFSYEPNPYFVTYVIRWSKTRGTTPCSSLGMAKIKAHMLKQKRDERGRTHINIQILQSIAMEKEE